MHFVNYVIYGCSSSRTTPGVITIEDLHTGEKTLLQLLLKIGWSITICKLKIQFCVLVDYSYLPEFFDILAIGQKNLSIYPPSFFNIYRVIIFSKFSR